jgi:hypothetical protein
MNDAGQIMHLKSNPILEAAKIRFFDTNFKKLKAKQIWWKKTM